MNVNMFKQPHSLSSLNGICRFLYTYFRPQIDSIINVIPSSIHWGDPQNLIHYDFTGNESQENFATTKENNNENIVFKFTQHILRITHYSLTTRLENDGNLFTSWKFEGSNNEITWDDLHSENDYQDFLQVNYTRTFPVKKRNTYKYFRVTHNGLSSENFTYFVLGKIEFFGKLCNLNEKCYFKMISSGNTWFTNLLNFFVTINLFSLLSK